MNARTALILLAAMFAGAFLPFASSAQATPAIVPVLNCYGGQACTTAQYAADDVSLACSRTSGFLRVEYDAATTPAPSAIDMTDITNAWAYAYDAFQRGPGDPAFATEMDELYLSVTAPRFPAQWRIYSNDPGRYYQQGTINQQRQAVDAVCQYVD